MVDTYRARISNSVVLKMPRRPASLASALGEGLSTLGGATGQMAEDNARTKAAIEASDQRIAEIEKARARAAAVATGAGALADMQIAIDQRTANLPEKANPGSQGYAAAVATVFKEETDRFLSALPDDPEVRQHFAGTIESTRARVVIGAQNYEDEQFAKYQGDSYQKLQDTERNKILTNPTGEQLAASLETLAEVRGGMQLDGVRAPRLATASANALTTGLLDGLVNTGNAGAIRELLNTGKLDTVLVDGQKDNYLRLADNVEAAAARAAELKAGEARQAALEGLKLLGAQQDGGQAVPASQWQAAIGAAKAAGVEASALQEWANRAEAGVADGQIRGLTTAVLEDQVRAMQAKRDAGQLDPREAQWLERGEKALKDRGGEAGAKLKPLLQGGIETRLQGLAQLHAMPLEQRWRAAEAAGDPRAAIEAGMPAEARAWAVQGAATRKDRKDQFLPAKTAVVKDPEAELNRVFDAVIGADLKRSLGPAYVHLRDVALDIMAARSGGWNPRDFGRAAQVAFGATQRADGSTQGGLGTIRGRRMELPEKWTQGEFDQRYSRYGFEGAVYGDGKPAQAEDVRRNFRLEVAGVNAASDTLYRLIGPDGKPLGRKRADGKVEAYVLPVPARPR